MTIVQLAVYSWLDIEKFAAYTLNLLSFAPALFRCFLLCSILPSVRTDRSVAYLSTCAEHLTDEVLSLSLFATDALSKSEPKLFLEFLTTAEQVQDEDVFLIMEKNDYGEKKTEKDHVEVFP